MSAMTVQPESDDENPPDEEEEKVKPAPRRTRRLRHRCPLSHCNSHTGHDYHNTTPPPPDNYKDHNHNHLSDNPTGQDHFHNHHLNNLNHSHHPSHHSSQSSHHDNVPPPATTTHQHQLQQPLHLVTLPTDMLVPSSSPTHPSCSLPSSTTTSLIPSSGSSHNDIKTFSVVPSQTPVYHSSSSSCTSVSSSHYPFISTTASVLTTSLPPPSPIPASTSSLSPSLCPSTSTFPSTSLPSSRPAVDASLPSSRPLLHHPSSVVPSSPPVPLSYRGFSGSFSSPPPPASPLYTSSTTFTPPSTPPPSPAAAATPPYTCSAEGHGVSATRGHPILSRSFTLPHSLSSTPGSSSPFPLSIDHLCSLLFSTSSASSTTNCSSQRVTSPSSPSFSSRPDLNLRRTVSLKNDSLPLTKLEYLISPEFLSRVHNVAMMMADKFFSLKDLREYPWVTRNLGTSQCLPQGHYFPHGCIPGSHRGQEKGHVQNFPPVPVDLTQGHPDSSQMKEQQQTAGDTTRSFSPRKMLSTDEDDIPSDLREYCKNFLLAVLCPRLPQSKATVIMTKVTRMEGRAYDDHPNSKIKYCWRLSTALCLILEDLGRIRKAR